MWAVLQDQWVALCECDACDWTSHAAGPWNLILQEIHDKIMNTCICIRQGMFSELLIDALRCIAMNVTWNSSWQYTGGHVSVLQCASPYLGSPLVLSASQVHVVQLFGVKCSPIL